MDLVSISNEVWKIFNEIKIYFMSIDPNVRYIILGILGLLIVHRIYNNSKETNKASRLIRDCNNALKKYKEGDYVYAYFNSDYSDDYLPEEIRIQVEHVLSPQLKPDKQYKHSDEMVQYTVNNHSVYIARIKAIKQGVCHNRLFYHRIKKPHLYLEGLFSNELFDNIHPDYLRLSLVVDPEILSLTVVDRKTISELIKIIEAQQRKANIISEEKAKRVIESNNITDDEINRLAKSITKKG